VRENFSFENKQSLTEQIEPFEHDEKNAVHAGVLSGGNPTIGKGIRSRSGECGFWVLRDIDENSGKHK